MAQKNLSFDGTKKGGVDPIALFEGWLEAQHPPFKLATKRIYLFLWKRFISWTNEHRLHFSILNEAHIVKFLAELEDTNRQQRERYQLIIYRAYCELQQLDQSFINPAQPSSINDIHSTSWRNTSANQAKQFLLPTENKALIKALNAEYVVLSDNGQSLAWPTLWKRRRNSTIIALLLGCGLKALEVLSLKQSAVITGEKTYFQLDTGQFMPFSAEEQKQLNRTSPDASHIHAYISDYNGQHRILNVPDWACDTLTLWLQTLDHDSSQHDGLLFPAARKPRAGHHSLAMNPATLARVVNGWAKLHGFTALSAQKLRNSYGAACLEEGATINDLNAKMGFVASAAGGLRLASEWQQFLLSQPQTEH